MSEMKRVSFTTLSNTTLSTTNFGPGGSAAGGLLGGISSGALTASSSRFGAGQQNADRVGTAGGSADRKINKTMRLAIELFPTDSCQYPEFNYSRLLHLEKVSPQ